MILNPNNKPEFTPSVEEFIEMGAANNMTYTNFAVLSNCTGEVTNIYAQNNVIYDYINEIKDRAVPVYFTDLDYIKYRYNPKRFAYDVYGSTELYFIVLAVNGMCNFKDFNKKKIKALYKSDVYDLLEKIYRSESKYLRKNREQVRKVIDGQE